MGNNDRKKMHRIGLAVVAGTALAVAGIAPPVQADGFFGPWQDAVPVSVVNDSGGGGCPIETEDGLSLMFASGRPGGQGMLDIWVTDRESLTDEWRTPVNVAAPVNSTASDFCPTPVYGRSLLFVSERQPELPGQIACGSGDIYFSRQSPSGAWSEPRNLGCAPDGPNFVTGERSPSLVETRFGTYLFYSSSGDGSDSDIYVSRMSDDGSFGPGHKVWGVNTTDNEIMPNVRQNEHGILEMVFSSNRMSWGATDTAAFGGQDVYVSYGVLPGGLWTRPRNLGPAVNSAVDDQRATLSADGLRLYFGRPGGQVMVSTRTAR
ncbi:MAG: hypothetical protein PVF57_10970 [Pseudomonadales bacterium]